MLYERRQRDSKGRLDLSDPRTVGCSKLGDGSSVRSAELDRIIVENRARKARAAKERAERKQRPGDAGSGIRGSGGAV